MKRTIGILTLILGTVLFTGCEKNNPQPNQPLPTASVIELSNDSQMGNMRNTVFSYYTITGEERTEYYNNTSLITIDSVDFNKTFTMAATNGILTSQGWIQPLSCNWVLKRDGFVIQTYTGEYFDYTN